MEELFGLWGKEKKSPWSEISKPYAAPKTTAHQLGPKIRFSPNKCGSQSTLTSTWNKRRIDFAYVTFNEKRSKTHDRHQICMPF